MQGDGSDDEDEDEDEDEEQPPWTYSSKRTVRITVQNRNDLDDFGNRRPYFAAVEWGGTAGFSCAVSQYFVSNSSTITAALRKKSSSDRARERRASLRLLQAKKARNSLTR